MHRHAAQRATSVWIEAMVWYSHVSQSLFGIVYLFSQLWSFLAWPLSSAAFSLLYYSGHTHK